MIGLVRTSAAIGFGLGLALALASELAAQPATGEAQGNVPANQLVLPPGYGMMLTLSEPFTSIVVGDPELVDAIVQTERQIVLRAKHDAVGNTNILVIGTAGQHLYSATVSLGRPRVVTPPPTPGVVVVTPAPIGGLVRVITSPNNIRTYQCSDVDCDRYDKLPSVQPEQRVTVTQPAGNNAPITLPTPAPPQ